MKTLRWLLGLPDNPYDRAVIDQMRRDWDERATQNAQHHVATLQENWTDQEFAESGAIWVRRHVETDLAQICNGRPPESMRILEIGCGMGRMTVPLSRIFGHVDAVDISPEMISRARKFVDSRSNIRLNVNNGVDLSMFPDESFDFVLSAIVFQHIPKRAVVENYIKETWRVLRPGSLFKFQVQGYPIPDDETNTWLGASFSEAQMRGIAARYRFQIRNSDGAGMESYWLTFAKP